MAQHWFVTGGAFDLFTAVGETSLRATPPCVAANSCPFSFQRRCPSRVSCSRRCWRGGSEADVLASLLSSRRSGMRAEGPPRPFTRQRGVTPRGAWEPSGRRSPGKAASWRVPGSPVAAPCALARAWDSVSAERHVGPSRSCFRWVSVSGSPWRTRRRHPRLDVKFAPQAARAEFSSGKGWLRTVQLGFVLRSRSGGLALLAG